MRRTAKLMLGTPGVAHVVPFAGFDGATFTNAPNAGVIFSALAPFSERAEQGLSAGKILGELTQRLASVQDAFIITIPPPPVRGIGNAGGFKMMVQDKRGRGLEALDAANQDMVGAANQTPGIVGAFSLFNTRTPKIYADIDRVRAEMLGVSADKVFETLEVYVGSAFVNEFNLLGRTYRVTAQADGKFRQNLRDIANLKTRNDAGAMVPIGAVASFRDITGPYRVTRYNLFPAAEIQGNTPPGFSTGQTLAAMEKLAAERLPDGFGYQWTELAFQQKLAGANGLLVFVAAVVFVFLALAAQYESWSLPLAVILIVPMCLLAGVTGLQFRQLDVDILGQIGFVVLVGLAAKNAILIVEFAKQAEERGADRFAAAVEAAHTRLRPILMTSLRLHPRRRAAGDRGRRRRRDAPVARHRRLQRHARRHLLRLVPDADLLRRDALGLHPLPRRPRPCARRCPRRRSERLLACRVSVVTPAKAGAHIPGAGVYGPPLSPG